MKPKDEEQLYRDLGESLRDDSFVLDKDSLRSIKEVFGDSWSNYRTQLEVLDRDARDGKAPSRLEIVKIFCQLVLMNKARPSDPMLERMAEWLLPLVNLPFQHDSDLRKGDGMQALGLSKKWPSPKEAWHWHVYWCYRSAKDSLRGRQPKRGELVAMTVTEMEKWPQEWKEMFFGGADDPKNLERIVRDVIKRFD